jgi:hypothetical protein
MNCLNQASLFWPCRCLFWVETAHRFVQSLSFDGLLFDNLSIFVYRENTINHEIHEQHEYKDLSQYFTHGVKLGMII